MSGDDLLDFETVGKKISKDASREDPILEIDFHYNGHNQDITERYHWHINFPYYVYKGYKAIKLEDYHYFSENSQLGQNIRQVKGGSIRAFQENLQQLIQLIKVHMMPLLKELKQAEFYKKWLDQITENDVKIQEMKGKGVSEDDLELRRLREIRNEAISHIKDKWVNEVDAGRMWQMNRSSTEQGLDFALLPQLFFGVNLDNPLYELHKGGKDLKTQLDEDVYPVDISSLAKEQVARFMFRFHTWLPTAIKETDVTFKVKISALKQFYAQLQMYINFMKPLLIEISRKSEGFHKENFFRDFENENPDFVNLFDYSYSFIKIFGIKGFEREGYKLDDLEFTNKGLFIKSGDILSGSMKGKSGFIKSEKKDLNNVGNYLYEFYPCEKDVSDSDFAKIKAVMIKKEDIRSFQIMNWDFSQRRRTDIIQSDQGPQQIPFMANHIKTRAYCWNLYELASYREFLKEDNLNLLETFIDEIRVVKEDLLHYVRGMDNSNEKPSVESSRDIKKSNSSDFGGIIFAPFKGFSEIFSPLIPSFKKSGSSGVKYSKFENIGIVGKRNEHHLINKIAVAEDTWKMYTIFKKTYGYMQY